MPVESDDVYKPFERGVVMLSLDTEQIWGYVDLFDEGQFRRRYPDAVEAHAKLLACLTKAGVSATWFMVGGMALHGSKGRWDPRMAALPPEWTNRIPGGVEETASLWFRARTGGLQRPAARARDSLLPWPHGGALIPDGTNFFRSFGAPL